jgi:hypothetical protein
MSPHVVQLRALVHGSVGRYHVVSLSTKPTTSLLTSLSAIKIVTWSPFSSVLATRRHQKSLQPDARSTRRRRGFKPFAHRSLSLPYRPLHLIGVSIGVLNIPLLLGQGDDEFAAEGGDVWDHAAPDQVALAERRLVHPGRAGVL